MALKIKCTFCDKNLGNADYRATVHTNEYHKLIFKIHEIIAECEEPHDDSVYLKLTNKDINNIIIQNLKSLLENEK